MNSLTIAIPTYNRNQILVSNLAQLLPQLTARCELLIIDNHSDIPVQNSIGTMLASTSAEVQIVRNAANVGGDANILRCIEFAANEFVWILGDDDAPAPDAVSKIFKEIDSASGVDVFKFFDPTTGERPPTDHQKIKGAATYLRESDSLGSLIFISAMVLRVSKAKNHLNQGNFYQTSCASQLIVLLKMMEAGSAAIISPSVLTPLTGAARASELAGLLPYRIAVAVPALLYSDWHPETRQRLKALLNGAWCLKMQISAVCALLISYSRGQITRQILCANFQVLCRSSQIAELFFSVRRLIRWVCAPLIIFPSVGILAARLLYKSIGK